MLIDGIRRLHPPSRPLRYAQPTPLTISCRMEALMSLMQRTLAKLLRGGLVMTPDSERPSSRQGDDFKHPASQILRKHLT